MKEFRKLSMNDLLNLCVEKKWYTLGDNDEYQEMLEMSYKPNLTTNDIAEIANNIKDHSNTEQDITGICFEIAKKCYSLFELD